MNCLEGSACRAVRGASGLAVKRDCRTIEPIRDLLLVAIDLNNFRLAASRRTP